MVAAVAVCSFPSPVLAAPRDHTWNGPVAGMADWNVSANWQALEGEGAGLAGIPDEGNEQAIMDSTLTGERDIRWKGFQVEKGPLQFRWTANGTHVDKVTLDEDMYLLEPGTPPARWINRSGDSSNMVLDLNGFATGRMPAEVIIPGMTFTDSSPGQTGVLDFTQGFRLFGGDGSVPGEGAESKDVVFDASINNVRSGPGYFSPYLHTLPSVTLYNTDTPFTGNPDKYRHQWWNPGGTIDGDLMVETAGYIELINGGFKQINGNLVFPLDNSGYTGMITNSLHGKLHITGDLIDPNTIFNSGVIGKTAYNDGAVVFNGGGNVQTVDISYSDLGLRLEVDANSHVVLANDFHNTQGFVQGFVSRLGANSTLDVGSHTLTVESLVAPGSANAGLPVNLIYGNGGAINVDKNLINLVEFNVEITDLSSHTSGEDFTLITYGDSTFNVTPHGGTNSLDPTLGTAMLPAGWTHAGMEWDGITGGTVRLLSVTGPPAGSSFLWTATGAGDWNGTTNWNPNGTPNSVDAVANFRDAIQAPSNVTLQGNRTVNRIEFDNATNGYTVDAAGAFTLTLSQSSAPADPTLEVVSGSHSITADVSTANATTVTVAGGSTLTLGAVALQGNTLTKEGAGELQINGTSAGSTGSVVVNAGTLSGEGTVGSGGGGVLVSTGATVAPGTSTGTLTVDNSYQQSAGATLSIQVEGTSASGLFDVLAVNGAAQLNGLLDVTLEGGFSPSITDTYTILTTTGGLFDQGIDLTSSLPAGFSALINGNNLDLLFTATGFDADFNGDGAVDAADYTIWRDSLGATGIDPFDLGDANGDSMVDGVDYDIWKTSFGSAPANGAASSLVPEPISAMLGLLAFGFLALPGRQWFRY